MINRMIELMLTLMFAGGVLAAAEPSPEIPLSVKGGRFLTLNTVIRVNQIEAARNLNEGTDEPADPTAENPSRNWSLINRINQKQRRPEDAPVLLKDLTEEEQSLISKRYPRLFQREGIQPRSPALHPE